MTTEQTSSRSFTAVPPAPSPDVPLLADSPPTDHIILDVDGVKYRTRKSTLQISPYFANLFSGRWPLDLLPDGSLPLETDASIFPILLNYMRRPSTFPLLWTRDGGHDYIAYNKLLAEADFYGLKDLTNWLKDRVYLKAMQTGLKMEIHPGTIRLIENGRTNHTYLHSEKVQPWDSSWYPYDEAGGNEMAMAVDKASSLVPDRDPLPTDDVELVKSFEINVPSKGRYKCPKGDYANHILPEFCAASEEECIPSDWNEYKNKANLEYETLPTSIVTVVRYRKFLPELCTPEWKGFAHLLKLPEGPRWGWRD